MLRGCRYSTCMLEGFFFEMSLTAAVLVDGCLLHSMLTSGNKYAQQSNIQPGLTPWLVVSQAFSKISTSLVSLEHSVLVYRKKHIHLRYQYRVEKTAHGALYCDPSQVTTS